MTSRPRSAPHACAIGALIAVVALSGPAFARDIDPTLVRQARVSAASFAPDGSRAAFTVSAPVIGKKPSSTIWLYESGAERAQPATTGDGDTEPRWSPDGRTLAFIGRRDGGKAQIRLLSMSGGESLALGSPLLPVSTFEWSPSGAEIAYVAGAPSDKAEGGDEEVGSQLAKPKSLNVIDVATGVSRPLLPQGWSVGMIAWASRDTLVVSATDDFAPWRPVNRLFVVSTQTGAVKEIGRMPGAEFAQLRVAPDGKTIAFAASDDGPMAHDLYILPASGGRPVNLTGKGTSAAIDRPVTQARWLSSTALEVVVQDGFGEAVHSVDVGGKARVLRRFGANALSTWASAGPRALYAQAATDKPLEVWFSDGKAERAVTQLHPDMPALVRPEVLRYGSRDGVEIEAEFYAPQGQATPPLVVVAHGGPTGRWSHSVNIWAQLLVREGFAVLSPNIRGSVGYGQEFLSSNRADWGGGDFADVLAGVDYLVNAKRVDPERIGIGGWSYGGFMSAWAVTQSSRFKAAVVGAAMLDLTSQWSLEDPEIIPYDSWYIGTPWENPENFRRMSPYTHVKNVQAPTLLMVGSEDDVDAPPQNRQFFRALQMRGVKSELVVYPREGHRISEDTHVLDMYSRMVAWFVDNLKGSKP